ncbi:MAG: nitroreductase family protein, partial [Alphaproteobacteria bacterium]|nr:nitroreductase family protein [Alphaproteobacteria bacterium]
MHFLDALHQRKSVRAFLDKPVPRELVEELLVLASKSPSGTNIQPWKVHVVAGDVRRELERAVREHRETNPPDVRAEFPRMNKRKEPYQGRMRKLGKDMYGLIGIPKGDEGANWAQWGRNYKFFDAPVGLIFTVDKELDRMSYVDIGMFMQSFMLAAK